jgi:hypothetical protein
LMQALPFQILNYQQSLYLVLENRIPLMVR